MLNYTQKHPNFARILTQKHSKFLCEIVSHKKKRPPFFERGRDEFSSKAKIIFL